MFTKQTATTKRNSLGEAKQEEKFDTIQTAQEHTKELEENTRSKPVLRRLSTLTLNAPIKKMVPQEELDEVSNKAPLLISPPKGMERMVPQEELDKVAQRAPLPIPSPKSEQRMVNQEDLKDVANQVKETREVPLSPSKEAPQMVPWSDLNDLGEQRVAKRGIAAFKKLMEGLQNNQKVSAAFSFASPSQEHSPEKEKVNEAPLSLPSTKEDHSEKQSAGFSTSVPVAAAENPPSSSTSTSAPPQSCSSSSIIEAKVEVKFDLGKFAETVSAQLLETAQAFLAEIIKSQPTDSEQLHKKLEDLVKKKKTISPQEADTLKVVLEIQNLHTKIQQISNKEPTLKIEEIDGILKELTLLAERVDVDQEQIQALQNTVIAEKNKIYALKLKEACQQLHVRECMVINNPDLLKITLLEILAASNREDTEQIQERVNKDPIGYVFAEIELEQELGISEILDKLRERGFLKEPLTLTKRVVEILTFLKDPKTCHDDAQLDGNNLFESFQKKSLETLLLHLGEIKSSITQIRDAKTLRFFSNTLLPALMDFIISKMTPENLQQLAKQCSGKKISELAFIKTALDLLSLPAHVRSGLADELENFRTALEAFATNKAEEYLHLTILSTPMFPYIGIISYELALSDLVSDDELIKMARDLKESPEQRLTWWHTILNRSEPKNLDILVEALSQTAVLSFTCGNVLYGFYASTELARYTAVMLESINRRIKYLDTKIEKYKAAQAVRPHQNLSKALSELKSEKDAWEKERSNRMKIAHPTHPITQMIVSYASSLLKNQTIFKQYSDFNSLQNKFCATDSANVEKKDLMVRVLEDLNMQIIQIESRRTISLPEFNLGKNKYVSDSDNKNFFLANLKNLGISFSEIKEGIKQEIDSIEKNIIEKTNKLLQKETDLAEKNGKLKPLDEEIKWIESQIISPNTTEKCEKNQKLFMNLQFIKLKKQLAKSNLEAKIKSDEQAIAEINQDIQSLNTLHGSLSNLLPQPEIQSLLNISLDMFIAWIQSKAFSKYLQGSFMKYMMQQLQYQQDSNRTLDAFSDQAKNLPDFSNLIHQYIQQIESASDSLTQKNSADHRISVLQTAAEDLKQSWKQAQESLAAAKKIADLTKSLFEFHPPAGQILQSTLEKRLEQLANQMLPTPVQAPAPVSASGPAPTASAPTLSRQNSDAKNTVKGGFWARLSRSSQSGQEPPDAGLRKSSSTFK